MEEDKQYILQTFMENTKTDLAVIGQELKSVVKSMQEVNAKQQLSSEILFKLQVSLTTIEAQLKQNDKDIDDLKKEVTKNNAFRNLAIGGYTVLVGSIGFIAILIKNLFEIVLKP